MVLEITVRGAVDVPHGHGLDALMNIAGGLVVPWDRPVYRETPVGHLVPEYALAGGRERPQLFRKRIPKGSGVTGPPIGERELELVDELVFVGLLPDLDEPVDWTCA